MAAFYRYRVWCVTEGIYVYADGETTPTQCPNNAGHTIDPTKTALVTAYLDRNTPTIVVSDESQLDAAVARMNLLGGGNLVLAAAISITGAKNWDLGGITIFGDGTSGTQLDFPTSSDYLNVSGGAIFNKVRFNGHETGDTQNCLRFINPSNGRVLFLNCMFKNLIGDTNPTTSEVIRYDGTGSGWTFDFIQCDSHSGDNNRNPFTLRNVGGAEYINVGVSGFLRQEYNYNTIQFLGNTASSVSKYASDGSMLAISLPAEITESNWIGPSLIYTRDETSSAAPDDYVLLGDATTLRRTSVENFPHPVIMVDDEDELDNAVDWLNTIGGGIIIVTSQILLTSDKSYDLTGIKIMGHQEMESRILFNDHTITLLGSGCYFENVIFYGTLTTVVGQDSQTLFEAAEGATAVGTCTFVFMNSPFRNCVGDDNTTPVIDFSGLNGGTYEKNILFYNFHAGHDTTNATPSNPAAGLKVSFGEGSASSGSGIVQAYCFLQGAYGGREYGRLRWQFNGDNLATLVVGHDGSYQLTDVSDLTDEISASLEMPIAHFLTETESPHVIDRNHFGGLAVCTNTVGIVDVDLPPTTDLDEVDAGGHFSIVRRGTEDVTVSIPPGVTLYSNGIPYTSEQSPFVLGQPYDAMTLSFIGNDSWLGERSIANFTRIATSEASLDQAIYDLSALGGGTIIITDAITLTEDKCWDLSNIIIQGQPIGHYTGVPPYIINFNDYVVTLLGGCFFQDMVLNGTLTTPVGNPSQSLFFAATYNCESDSSSSPDGMLEQSGRTYQFVRCQFHNCVGGISTGAVLDLDGLNDFVGYDKYVTVRLQGCTLHTDNQSSFQKLYGLIINLGDMGAADDHCIDTAYIFIQDNPEGNWANRNAFGARSNTSPASGAWIWHDPSIQVVETTNLNGIVSTDGNQPYIFTSGSTVRNWSDWFGALAICTASGTISVHPGIAASGTNATAGSWWDFMRTTSGNFTITVPSGVTVHHRGNTYTNENFSLGNRPWTTYRFTCVGTDEWVLSITNDTRSEPSIQFVTQAAHGFTDPGTAVCVVHHNGTSWVKAQANSAQNAESCWVVTNSVDVDHFIIQKIGNVDITGWGLTAATVYFLDPDTAGAITTTKPSNLGQVHLPIIYAHTTTEGEILHLIGHIVTLTSGSGTDANKTWEFLADMMALPNNSDWGLNAPAGIIADPSNLAIPVAAFDDTDPEGIGMEVHIPLDALRLRMTLEYRAASAPSPAASVDFRLRYRAVPDNSPIPVSWTTVELSSLPVPTNTYYQYGVYDVSLATLGLTAGQSYIFELSRYPAGDDDLSGDLYARSVRIYIRYDNVKWIPADAMQSPLNADWAVNANAPIAADSNNAALQVRRHDDTTEEGCGIEWHIPIGTAKMGVHLRSRAETDPGELAYVGVSLWFREMADGVAISAWDVYDFPTTVVIPANDNWQYDFWELDMATLGLNPGSSYQFELTRITHSSSSSGDLSGDWNTWLYGFEWY